MSVEVYAPPQGSSPELPDLMRSRETLAEIGAIPDGDEQLRRILWIKQDLLGYPDPGYHFGDVYSHGEAAEDLRARLAEFASDPTASSSVMVRMTALENAIDLGYGSKWLPDRAARRELERDGQSNEYAPQKTDGIAYRDISLQLAKADGLDIRTLFPYPTNDEVERGQFDDSHNPVLVHEYLSRLQAAMRAGKPDAETEQFAPLIRAMESRLAEHAALPRIPHIDIRDWQVVGKCARLLEYGDQYRSVLIDVLEEGDVADKESLKLLAEMTEFSKDASRVFPDRYRHGVEEGLNHALADGLYAVLGHVSNDTQTDIGLQLSPDGKPLPLKLDGGESLELLRRLHIAFAELAGIGRLHVNRTIAVSMLDGAAQYRLMDRRGSLTNTSVYVRPRGAETYHADMEYGRPGEGVEASIGYVVDTDLDAGRLPEVGKHRGKGDDGRISIRLDREGIASYERNSDMRRDPTRQDGTLSLDVGSIIGKDDWTSTKVGRFLAWGNALRAGATGEHVRLNHVTEYFTPEDGDADVFAAEATRLSAGFEATRMTRDQIAQGVSRTAKPVGWWL